MTDRQEIETKVAGLQEMLQKIQGELSAKEAGVKNLGEDRRRVMVAALERGKRANTDKLTVEIAHLEAQVASLRVEAEMAQNVLDNQCAALEPFLVNERLLADCERWEAACYQVKALYDRRGDDWQALKDYRAGAWRRDEAGLGVLVDAGVGPEGELRRHKAEGTYLAGAPEHYSPFLGLYPECMVILRQLQTELRGGEVEPPMIRAVSAKAIAQSLQQGEGDSAGRLARYKAFENFYIQDGRPDDSPYDELRGGVIFQYGV